MSGDGVELVDVVVVAVAIVVVTTLFTVLLLVWFNVAAADAGVGFLSDLILI